MMNDLYEIVIGLEVHAELRTETKIFCSCKTEFGAEPNTLCCPICLGMPGALPVLNRKAVEYAVRAGLATNCEIALYSKFDRKNYFYPDLPKGYQISQYDMPICKNGYVSITSNGSPKKIGITRIHLEEDAGKLIHDRAADSLADFNRCGIPLIEIVSEPDMRTAEEAVEYLRTLRSLIMYSGISDCKMNEGSFRCDVNISVRRRGDTSFGVRSEIKNLNSFSFVSRAVKYEAERQISLIESGGRVERETRRFDPDSGKTYTMRKKERESDYRFFPEPDLPPILLTNEDIEEIRATMPDLPSERAKRYAEEFSLTEKDSAVILADAELAGYFEAVAELSLSPKTSANIIISDVLAFSGGERIDDRIPPTHLAALSDLFYEAKINSSIQKKLVKRMWEDGIDPIRTVTEEKLLQITDPEELQELALTAINENPKAVEDFKRGKTAAAKTIMGTAMSKSGGKADPKRLGKIIEEILSKI